MSAPIAAGGSGPVLTDMAVASDGTGAVTYLADVDGTRHAFLARLTDGALATARELDASLPAGESSDPVVAAGPGGELVAAFAHGGNLYTASTSSTADALSAPAWIASGASSPSLSLNQLGQGYLAYTQTNDSDSDVDVDFWNGAGWRATSFWQPSFTLDSNCDAQAPEAVNTGIAGTDAGGSGGAPAVVAAHDGVGLVAWGEGGHIYSRRVWGTCASADVEQDDLATYAPTGASTAWTERSADDPVVASDGDSTYQGVAFQEQVASGAQTEERVFLARQVSDFAPAVTAVDGFDLAGADATGGATEPAMAMNEVGSGAVAAVGVSAGQVVVTPLANQGVPTSAQVLGTTDATGSGTQLAVTGEGNQSSMVVWIGATTSGDPEVVERYAMDLGAYHAAVVLSGTDSGTVDAGGGVLAASDGPGDGLVAWAQAPASGSGEETIELAGVLGPPHAPSLRPEPRLTSRERPTLRWHAATEDFGPVTYDVYLMGRRLASTSGLSLRTARPLAAGTYSWHVVAVNGADERATSATRRFTVKRYVKPKHKRRHKRGRKRKDTRKTAWTKAASRR